MSCWVCCTVAVNKVASVVLSRLQRSDKTFFHSCGLLYSAHLAFSTYHRAAPTRSAKILDRPRELSIWNISWIFEVKTILPYRNQSKTTIRFNNWSSTDENMSFNNVLRCFATQSITCLVLPDFIHRMMRWKPHCFVIYVRDKTSRMLTVSV